MYFTGTILSLAEAPVTPCHPVRRNQVTELRQIQNVELLPIGTDVSPELRSAWASRRTGDF